MYEPPRGIQKFSFLPLLPFNTDKYQHGYLPIYESLAGQIGRAGQLCELGVYSGGSLEMWVAYFPDGLVVGVDNDEKCKWPIESVKILADQTDRHLPANLTTLAPQGYDLIIDDCSHVGKLTERSFDLLWPLVKPGRWYVIEDWISAKKIMGRSPENFIERIRVNAIGIKSLEYTKEGLIIIQKEK